MRNCPASFIKKLHGHAYLVVVEGFGVAVYFFENNDFVRQGLACFEIGLDEVKQIHHILPLVVKRGSDKLAEIPQFFFAKSAEKGYEAGVLHIATYNRTFVTSRK